MKKVRYIVNVTLLMCLFGCSASDHHLLRTLQNEIEKHVALAKNDIKGYSTFKLSDITDFDWDKFYVFDEYVTNKQLKEITGITWDGAAPSRGDKRILFIYKQKVVRYIDYNPANFPLFIYLCGPSEQYEFNKNDDPFCVFGYWEHKKYFWAMVPSRCIKDFEQFYKHR